MATQNLSDEFQNRCSAMKSGQKKGLVKKARKIKENMCDENEIEELDMNKDEKIRKLREVQKTAPLMNLRMENIYNEMGKESKIRKMLWLKRQFSL